MRKLTLALVVFGVCLLGQNAFAEGIDEYTKLLLHNDNASFVDSSFFNHTVTNSGAQLDTMNKKFGSGSARFQGGSYPMNIDDLNIADSSDWNFGTGDFTIDFWVRFNSLPPGPAYIFAGQYAGEREMFDSWYLALDIHEKLAMRFNDPTDTVRGSYIMPSEWPDIDTNIWHHLAFERYGGTGLIFIDGISQNLTEIVAFGTNDVGDTHGLLRIGDYNDNPPTNFLDGWIDEFRISKGIARWTSNFTPPTEPYSVPIPESVIPEPTTFSLLGFGLFGLVFRRKKTS